MTPFEANPLDFAPMLSLSRAFSKAVNEAIGISITDFRILTYVLFHDENDRDSQMGKALGIQRNAVSMSIAKLMDMRFVCRQEGRRGGSVSSTLAGRDAFRLCHSALEKAISGDEPFMHPNERETANHYMVMMADRLGAPIMIGGSIDLTLVYVEVNSRVKRMLKQSCTSFGLTPNSFTVLSGISHSTGEVRPTSLAKLLHMSKPEVTSTCATLVNRGFVQMRQHARDGRGKTLLVTPAGTEALANANAAFWSDFADKVRGFKDEEFAFFRTVNARK